MTPEDYEAILGTIAGKAHKAVSHCLVGSPRSVKTAIDLCGEILILAGNARQQSMMEREREGVEGLDLKRLPMPVIYPEREE